MALSASMPYVPQLAADQPCEVDVKLYAISDLHLDYRVNREALDEIPDHREDWLITGGDLCTKGEHLRQALEVLCRKFAVVFWIPGNHELWSSSEPGSQHEFSGEAKYRYLVDICRGCGVHTPEDPFVTWPGLPEPHIIAPLFIPYDYSFRPADVTLENAVNWAMDAGILCRDEKLISPAPFPDMVAWCEQRLSFSRERLDAVAGSPLVLINHFPLREDLIRLWRIPRFSIWCGTKRTERLHLEYPARVVVSGHLHMRATDVRDGVRFEEVSLGYPRDWDQGRGIDYYLREILPGPPQTIQGNAGPIWRFH